MRIFSASMMVSVYLSNLYKGQNWVDYVSSSWHLFSLSLSTLLSLFSLLALVISYLIHGPFDWSNSFALIYFWTRVMSSDKTNKCIKCAYLYFVQLIFTWEQKRWNWAKLGQIGAKMKKYENYEIRLSAKQRLNTTSSVATLPIN